MTESKFIKHLTAFIKEKYETRAAAARAWGVKPQFVSAVLNKVNPARPTATMIKDAGYVKTEHTVINYKKV